MASFVDACVLMTIVLTFWCWACCACEQDVDGVVQSFRGVVKAKPRTQKGCLAFKVFFDADGETVWVPVGSDESRTWSFAT